MRQRILLHTPEPASSAALYVDELARALTDCGIPIGIVCPENHQARKNFELNPLITLHLSAPRFTRSSDSFLRKLWANLVFLLSSCTVLFRTARKGDIVHFQYLLHFPFGALFFLCARLRRCTIVFTVHDPLPHKWLLPARFRAIEKGALAWSYHSSHVLFVHSESGRSTLLQHFPESAHKVRVIAHGPYELNVPLPPMPQSQNLEVLLFGALRENKGPHLAIAAVQQLHRAGVPIRLTIAGRVLNRKEQAYWEECRKQIDLCPQPIHLREEFIPDDCLPQLFGDCHCFLLPYTSFSSDSGVAFMALANGRPIVSTKAGGLGSLLDASGGGLPIEQPTVPAIVDALEAAVRLGPAQLDRLGQQGKTWVLEECNWPKVARQTREIYQQWLQPLPQEHTNELPEPAIFN